MPRPLGPLTLFPIWTDAPFTTDRRYQIPAAGSVGVAAEREDGPSVAELVLHSESAAPFLVLAGMTLDGGWQHRVVTRSIVAGPRQRTRISVRCVEQSRWHGQAGHRFSLCGIADGEGPLHALVLNAGHELVLAA